MMKKSHTLFLVALLMLAAACTEAFDPKISPAEDVLVVEALITDGAGPHFVRLTKTAPFQQNPSYRAVRDAAVIVKNQHNEVVVFTEDSPGHYLSPDDFAAVTGDTYVLQIETSTGEMYASNEQTIMPDTSVDSLDISFDSVKLPMQDAFGEVVYEDVPGVKFFADLEEGVNGIPRMRFRTQVFLQYVLEEMDEFGQPLDDPVYLYCRRKVNLDRKVNVTIPFIENTEDDVMRHEIGFMPAAFRFFEGLDTFFLKNIDRRAIILHQYSLNRDSYSFYKSLHDQMSAEGRIFDPIAAQLEGNMRCISHPEKMVFGHFEASSYTALVFLMNPEPVTINRYWINRRPDLDYIIDFPDYSECGFQMRLPGWIYN